MKKFLTTALFSFLNFVMPAQMCPSPTAQMDLDINNVRARILNGGDLWNDPILQTPHYEVPIGSGKNAIYAGSFWIGGLDAGNQVYVAAQTYRQQASNDFWPGPISKNPFSGAISVSNTVCSDFDMLFPITKAEVLSFISGGPATSNINNWPGNGNVSNFQLPNPCSLFLMRITMDNMILRMEITLTSILPAVIQLTLLAENYFAMIMYSVTKLSGGYSTILEI
jgi:hypothetical protein